MTLVLYCVLSCPVLSCVPSCLIQCPVPCPESCPLGPRDTTSRFDWRSRVKSFASLDERTHLYLHLASNAAFGTRCESWNIAVVSHFAPILFTKRSKGYNLLGRLQDRSKSKFGVVFLQTTTFSQSVFFFQHSSVQLLKRTNEIEIKFSNCGPTVKGGQPTTWCQRQRFMFDKLPRWLSAGRQKVDARVNSEIRESKVDNLRRKGKDIISNRIFSTMRMIRHRPFPSKDESTNGGWGHQTTKKRKIADATASTQASPLRWCDCVWRRVFAIFRRRHGNLEKRSCVNRKKT